MARRRSLENQGVSKRLQSAFGDRLHVARRAAGVGRHNQEVLAEALEITRTSISNIERGRHRVFLDQVYLAARALKVPLTDLLPPLEEVFTDAPVFTVTEAEFDQVSVLRVSEVARDLQRRETTDSRSSSTRSGRSARPRR
jgi:transcriptional regulator with XRE-family HTH domain